MSLNTNSSSADSASASSSTSTLTVTSPPLTPYCILTGHTDRVWHIAFSPNGSALVSCSGDRTIRLWTQTANNSSSSSSSDCISYEFSQLLDGVHTRTVRSLAFSPNGKFLASAGFDGLTAIWENVNGVFECVSTLEGHENEVKCVRFSSDGKLIATCSRDKSIWLWESDSDRDFECLSVLSGHSQDVKFVTFSPAASGLGLVASCGYDNSIKIWSEEEDDYYCQSTLTGHDSTVWCLAFEPESGNYIVSVGDDKQIILWRRDLTAQKTIYRPIQKIADAHDRSIFYCDWSKTNRIATASADDAVNIYEFDSVTERIKLIIRINNSHAGDANCAVWNPINSTILATAGDDKLVKLWKINESNNDNKKSIASSVTDSSNEENNSITSNR